ncbi:hypothetical protein MCOO_00060 [Mycobacterium cookii]|uniref:Uncharacterized protein n=1 Tax=Mycobacterium cookii TaxID=1775 RepID=A0A7I7KQX9_9MYCO|nr:hypothetical protein MCOO_00060 [Mycobacterium cookii]
MPTAERPLVDEAQRGAVVKDRGDAKVTGIGDFAEQHLPTHAEVNDQCLVVAAGPVEGEPQIFPASVAAGDPGVEQPRGEIGGACFMAADSTRVMHADGGDCLTDHVGLQSAPHHLDFRQLGHLLGRFSG